eukprot:COSAG06_NODE_5351_length_3532_cov_2.775415_4_plen_206_part_00
MRIRQAGRQAGGRRHTKPSLPAPSIHNQLCFYRYSFIHPMHGIPLENNPTRMLIKLGDHSSHQIASGSPAPAAAAAAAAPAVVASTKSRSAAAAAAPAVAAVARGSTSHSKPTEPPARAPASICGWSSSRSRRFCSSKPSKPQFTTLPSPAAAAAAATAVPPPPSPSPEAAASLSVSLSASPDRVMTIRKSTRKRRFFELSQCLS